jgi:hypothetical protein
VFLDSGWENKWFWTYWLQTFTDFSVLNFLMNAILICYCHFQIFVLVHILKGFSSSIYVVIFPCILVMRHEHTQCIPTLWMPIWKFKNLTVNSSLWKYWININICKHTTEQQQIKLKLIFIKKQIFVKLGLHMYIYAWDMYKCITAHLWFIVT